MYKSIFLGILFSIFLLFNIYASTSTSKDSFFKIEKNDDEIIYIETINVLDINNKKVGGKSWSSAVILNNGNLLVGEYKSDKTYDYYEINKKGEKQFIVNSQYYIESINDKTGNFITVKKENDNYYMGVLDKEFNVVYDDIFLYKKDAFLQDNEILKVKNKNYGVFSIYGITIIEPLFDSIEIVNKNTYEAIFNDNKYIIKIQNGVTTNETAILNIPKWAKETTIEAINLGFISDFLQLKLNENITRAEFCEILINLYEHKTGFKIDVDEKSPFIDTNDIFVLKAYNLGIVSGISRNKFEPNSYITREQASVILNNFLKNLEYNLNYKKIYYNDEKNISSWARESINSVGNLGIMNGNTKGYFNPKNNYKVIEAISTIIRVYNL